MRIKGTDIRQLQGKCTRSGPPPCRAACPLGLDIRGVIEKIAQGNGNGEHAARLYAKATVFPRIVAWLCPGTCEAVCPDGVHIRALERQSMSFLGNIAPAELPAKSKKVAILGGGLQGLSCALRLAARGWLVTVFDPSDRLGGDVWERLPKDLVEADFARLKESRVTFCFPFDGNISLSDFDYVYSSGPEASVFAIGRGIRDAEAIEKGLKLNCAPELTEQSATAPPPPSSIPVDTLLNLQSEAQKCGGCLCSVCVDDCPMMQYYKRTPDKLFIDVAATLGSVKGISKRIAQKQINSCNLCGLCECPVGIDMEKMFADARHSFVEEGRMPPAYHRFFMADMAHAMSEQAFTVVGKKSPYLFFPGCQLGASKPEYVLRTYDILKDVLGDVALLLACCGAPAFWAGDTPAEDETLSRLDTVWLEMGKPQVILSCPSCYKRLREKRPDWTYLALYTVLSKAPPPVKATDRHASVFDPCAAHDQPEYHEAVCSIARQSGFTLSTSPPPSCCGNGGHMRAVVPELFDQIARKSIFSTDEDAITYCSNCRDIFASRGKRAIHVLDLYLDGDLESAFSRRSPSWGERRSNRELLKARLTGAPPPNEGPRLAISDDLRQKLTDTLISEHEILQAIEHCEQSKEKIILKDSDVCIGHLADGSVTLWVKYRVLPDGFELLNAYSHRMQALEGAP